MKQTSTVQECLWRFNEAVTERLAVNEEEKPELFIDILKAQIAEAVEARSATDLLFGGRRLQREGQTDPGSGKKV